MQAVLKNKLEALAPPSLYHLTHANNLSSILKYGLYAHNNRYQEMDISDKQVNSYRQQKEPIYHRPIHDYVPFYFNPRNAMLYRIQKQHGLNIVILEFASEILLQDNTLVSDKNAATRDANFSNSLECLEMINWNIVFSQSWNGYGIHVKQAMMMEALVYKKQSIDKLQAIHCQSAYAARKINKILACNHAKASPELFF